MGSNLTPELGGTGGNIVDPLVVTAEAWAERGRPKHPCPPSESPAPRANHPPTPLQALRTAPGLLRCDEGVQTVRMGATPRPGGALGGWGKLGGTTWQNSGKPHKPMLLRLGLHQAAPDNVTVPIAHLET